MDQGLVDIGSFVERDNAEGCCGYERVPHKVIVPRQ